MKRLTALLLCFLLLCTCSVTAFAAESEAEETNTVISVTVPDSHKITVTADSARVFYEGVSGDSFTVERLSTPRLLIRAESGKVIKTVMLNGEDVTAELHGGYLDLAPVYEDKVITVTTEDEPVAPKETYTVTIPANTTVAFNATETDFGAIEVTAAQIHPNKCIKVELTSDGKLENSIDATKVIPYAIKDSEGAAFTSATYLTEGDKTELSIHITADDWNAAYAGEYSDTVTFTITYEDK